MDNLYVISGIALRFPGLFDYQARQLTEVVPAAGEAEALAAAVEALGRLAPEGEGWEGHTVRVSPLSAMLPAAAN